MANKADKREYVEQHIKEADAGVYAYDKSLVEDLRARFNSSPVDSQVNKNVQKSAIFFNYLVPLYAKKI